MARLTPGTAEYTEVFGAVAEVQTFTSELPEYYAITQAWADPSIRVDLGLDRVDGLYSKLARDVQAGARRMTWSLAVPGEANLPVQMFSAVRELVFSQAIPQQLSLDAVHSLFDPGNRPKGVPGLAGVALGAALAGLGTAVPIVGQIAGLLVAFGSAIYAAVNRNKIKRDLLDAKVREELYKSFPPLQVADSATDTQIARRVHALMESGDMTDIFMPRFKGDWVGVERDKGFAFAPGSTVVESNKFGEDQQQFEAAGGIGCIPNSGIITSVIQVSLDPRGEVFKKFQRVGHPDPRELAGAHESVIDTGSFYKATADQATLAWSLATRDRGEQGNPLLYRLNVKRMQDAWKAYFEGGVEYIKRVAFPWWNDAAEGAGDDTINANANLEGFYAPAVARAVVSFAADISGGTTNHPIYRVWAKPYGRYGDAMKVPGLYRYSENAGVFLPIRNPPGEGFVNGLGSQWDRDPNIKLVLEELAAQQRYDLQYTLASMYIRRSDAAFAGDDELIAFMDSRRRVLLTDKSEKIKKARKKIVWSDIPENEQLDGKLLRDVALEAGVSKTPSLGGGPTDLAAGPPRPKLPPLKAPMPLAGTAPRFFSTRVLTGLGLGLAAAAALYSARRDAPRPLA